MPEHQQLQQSKNPKPTYQNQVTHVSQTPVSNSFSIIQRAKINPKSLTHADILQLQRTIGNRAVGVLLSGFGNTSIAQQAPIQREESQEEDEELLQGKMTDTVQRQVPEEEELMQGEMIEPVQRQENPKEEEPLQKKRENNTGMSDNLKAGVESLSGIDMSDVRVHYNSSKPAEVGALAYTQGTNIHVAPGQERHLPHEAWHVVQQAKGRVKPTIQLKDGTTINDDKGLEHEADVMGERAFTSGQDAFFWQEAYETESRRGQELIAHELTHEAQQNGGEIGLSHDPQEVSPQSSALSPHSMSTEVQRWMRLGHDNSGSNEIAIQRYKYEHGPLIHESGTSIKTDFIIPGDIGGGSGVSAWPSWWPTGSAETANDFLRENFVQGHLLNEKLGGPGDQRYNLTPLTRSANSQMSASIENKAKSYLNKGQGIEYWVEAQYNTHPNVADVDGGTLPPGEQLKLQNELNKMAGQVWAQITVHNLTKKGSKKKWTLDANQPNAIIIKNEGSSLKGLF